MSKQARLDVGQRERVLEKRIVAEVDLPDREVIRSAPVGIHLSEKIGSQRSLDLRKRIGMQAVHHHGLHDCSPATPSGSHDLPGRVSKGLTITDEMQPRHVALEVAALDPGRSGT